MKIISFFIIVWILFEILRFVYIYLFQNPRINSTVFLTQTTFRYTSPRGNSHGDFCSSHFFRYHALLFYHWSHCSLLLSISSFPLLYNLPVEHPGHLLQFPLSSGLLPVHCGCPSTCSSVFLISKKIGIWAISSTIPLVRLLLELCSFIRKKFISDCLSFTDASTIAA